MKRLVMRILILHATAQQVDNQNAPFRSTSEDILHCGSVRDADRISIAPTGTQDADQQPFTSVIAAGFFLDSDQSRSAHRPRSRQLTSSAEVRPRSPPPPSFGAGIGFPKARLSENGTLKSTTRSKSPAKSKQAALASYKPPAGAQMFPGALETNDGRRGSARKAPTLACVPSSLPDGTKV